MKIREFCLQNLIELTKPLYGATFKAKKKPWNIKKDQLADFPDGSLGKELYAFLHANNLEVMDKFENHDVCHVLTEYSTNCVEESCMQFFLLGTGKKSLFVLGTVIISLFVLPEHIKRFVEAYQRGLKTPYFDDMQFEKCLDTPLIYLRQTLLSGKPKIVFNNIVN